MLWRPFAGRQSASASVTPRSEPRKFGRATLCAGSNRRAYGGTNLDSTCLDYHARHADTPKLPRHRFARCRRTGDRQAILAKPAAAADLHDWRVVREQFDLDPNFAHLGLFYLTSHPRPVRAAIESYRRKLDANPFLTVERNISRRREQHASARCGGDRKVHRRNAKDIALTHNTTTGLSLIYHGLPLKSATRFSRRTTILRAPRSDSSFDRSQRRIVAQDPDVGSWTGPSIDVGDRADPA